MVWFTGSVEEAVQLCKQRAGLLTIFVRGKRFHSHSGKKFSGTLFPQSNFSRVKYSSDNSDECSGLEAYFQDAEVEAVINQRSDILLLKITQGTTNFDLLNSVCKLETRVSCISHFFGELNAGERHVFFLLQIQWRPYLWCSSLMAPMDCCFFRWSRRTRRILWRD